MTENSKIDDLKEMLLNAEKKLGIERSDENFEKSRTEGFRIFKKILKEDPNYCEEVVSIFDNYGEQKRKLIWRYVAPLSIQINEIDPKNKPASGMLEEVVQFLDKMEKDEWKKDWDLVLRITKNVVSRDPKNESAKNLIIEAERIAKDEEEKMEVSVSENAKRLEKVEFEGLTEEGQMAWVVLKKMHGLYKKDSYWLCQANSDQEIHDKLFDALEKFIVSPNALSPDDVNVICERFVRTINLHRRKSGDPPYEMPDKLKEEENKGQAQTEKLNENTSFEKIETSPETSAELEDADENNGEETERNLDKMDQLLLRIKREESDSACTHVWFILGRELLRQKRKYDREKILLQYSDGSKSTILWKSDRGPKKISPMGKRTMKNRLSKLRNISKTPAVIQ